MRLSEIGINNFRLLHDVRMRLDAGGLTTILVGPNNSGKTSAIEALLMFLDGTARQVSINDFSLACRHSFGAFEKHVLSTTPGSAPDATLPAAPSAPELPSIVVRLTFSYDDTGPDLAIAGELLMDLDEAIAVVSLELRFSCESPEKLAQAYLAGRDPEQSLVEYLAATLHDHYELSLYKMSPDCTKRERLADRAVLKRLIRINVVSAQRHIDDREERGTATRLSTLLHTHYERRYKLDSPAEFKALGKLLREQSLALGPQYAKAFDGLMKGLTTFGHPESPKLTVRAEFATDGVFKDSTRVYYEAQIPEQQIVAAAEPPAPAPPRTCELPERYNGLGFKNLIYIVLKLKSFREDVEANLDARPRVHLIAVEEPEVHMHPQMQSVFVQKVSEYLSSSTGEATVQLLLTTHSSQMAAHCGFSPIRYFRRAKGAVEVLDLLAFEASAATDAEKSAMAFLRKYLTTTRCEVFFADKLVFIEGQVERLLLPRFIESLQSAPREKLGSTYICTVEVGGAYAHVFRNLIEYLKLPTLVVTDLDAIDGATKKKVPVASGTACSNATLKKWLPGVEDLSSLLDATDEQKISGHVRVAYQVAEAAGQPCARSFEEAFVYANAAWLVDNRKVLLATGDLFDFPDTASLLAAAHEIDFPKVDFALDLLATSGWMAPKYIREGLEWLSSQ